MAAQIALTSRFSRGALRSLDLPQDDSRAVGRKYWLACAIGSPPFDIPLATAPRSIALALRVPRPPSEQATTRTVER